MLVAFDPMRRTVPATSTSMTAIITAYSAMSWPSCCDHNLCIINCEFPLFMRLVQWLVRGGYRSTEFGCYSGNRFLRTYQRHGLIGPFMPAPPPGRLRLSSFRGRAVRPKRPTTRVSLGRFVLRPGLSLTPVFHRTARILAELGRVAYR